MIQTSRKIKRINGYIDSLRKETKEERKIANERYRVPKTRTEALKRKQTLNKRTRKTSKQGR